MTPKPDNTSNILFVLAGGFGTRLAKVVNEVPKPLASVNGIPFLELLMVSYLNQGITRFVFLLHHKAEQIIEFLEKANQTAIFKNCKFDYIREETPLGTGGAIANAVRELVCKDKFYVTNADTWLDSGIKELGDVELAGIGIVNVNDTSRFGTVIQHGGKVMEFKEKMNMAIPGYINAGLYFLHPGLFENWNGLAFSLESDLFPDLVKKNQLEARIISSDFIDIGIPEDYYKFQDWVKQGKIKDLK
jgi:D-glycero-alpha-D-manno-heptose 1-phosphate guanylyltransferase